MADDVTAERIRPKNETNGQSPAEVLAAPRSSPFGAALSSSSLLCLGAIAGWIFRTTLFEWLVVAYLTNPTTSATGLPHRGGGGIRPSSRSSNLRIERRDPGLRSPAFALDYPYRRHPRTAASTSSCLSRTCARFKVQHTGRGRPHRRKRNVSQVVFDGLTTFDRGLLISFGSASGPQQFEPGRVDISLSATKLLSSGRLVRAVTFGARHVDRERHGSMPGPDPFHWFLSRAG